MFFSADRPKSFIEMYQFVYNGSRSYLENVLYHRAKASEETDIAAEGGNESVVKDNSGPELSTPEVAINEVENSQTSEFGQGGGEDCSIPQGTHSLSVTPASESQSGQVSSEVYNCDICHQTCRSKAGLNRHKAVHKKVSCNTCKLTFANVETMEIHACTGGRLIPCTQCSEKFTDASLMEEHYKTNHNIVFTCKDCSETFKTSFELNRHSDKIHAKKDESKDRSHQCSVCLQCFATKNRRDAHEAMHGTDVSSKCSESESVNLENKAVEQEKESKAHFKRSKHNKHNCQHCSATFELSKDKKAHERICAENPNKDTPCKFCNQLFSDITKLATHLCTFHRQKVNLCIKCHHGFETEELLRCHSETCN